MGSLLEDLTSRDPHRIWAGACAVATLRDSRELALLCAHLTEIENKTRAIELGGALFPNSEHLKFALHKLRYYQAQSGCLCRLYPERLMFNPAREAEAGNIHILETDQSNPWNTLTLCQCSLCDTVFRVEEGESHYTWWKWSLLEPGETASAES